MKILDIWKLLPLLLIPVNAGEGGVVFDEERNRKSFYIMKVIYNSIIYRVLAINVRDVQQSLYIGKPKYILKIWKNGD